MCMCVFFSFNFIFAFSKYMFEKQKLNNLSQMIHASKISSFILIILPDIERLNIF
jgi:hypothetical protein